MRTDTKIEFQSAFSGKKSLIAALKSERLETLDDIWNFCVKNGAEDLRRIPGVGVTYSFDLISETIKFKQEQLKFSGINMNPNNPMKFG